jgi:hypothetical protein
MPAVAAIVVTKLFINSSFNCGAALQALVLFDNHSMFIEYYLVV